VNNFGVPLATTLPYAPAILHAHGYHTAAFVGALVLDPVARSVPGFDRGFDTYDAGFSVMLPGGDRYHTAERRGGVVVAHAMAWLDKHAHGPFFIWVHLYDPHDPYDPPEPYKSRYKSAPYDGEIAYADSAVGKLLGQLRAQGLYDNSVIAVMSDHGEALGGHGEDTHGMFLYDETIHVPLLFKLPEEAFAGERVDGRVGLVDVLPTMLQAVGISVPQEVQGESLLNMMKSASAEKAGSGSAAEEHQDSNSPTGRSMRNPIIRIPRIDGVRCERYERGSICSWRRRGGSCMTRVRIRRPSATWRLSPRPWLTRWKVNSMRSGRRRARPGKRLRRIWMKISRRNWPRWGTSRTTLRKRPGQSQWHRSQGQDRDQQHVAPRRTSRARAALPGSHCNA